MEERRLKNIVVLKNLPSNLVEEAIVVLKENRIKSMMTDTDKGKETEKSKKGQDYILKEAEMVVNNYLAKMENHKKESKHKVLNIEKKYRCLKLFTVGLAILMMVFLRMKF